MARPWKNNPTWKQKKTKFTRETLQKLEDAFALDATIEEACFYANISPALYYLRVKDDKKLLERFEALRQRPVLTARQTVVTALKTDPDMALKYLERKRKKEFGPDVPAPPPPIGTVTLNFINAPRSTRNLIGSPQSQDWHRTSVLAELPDDETDSDQ